MLLNFYVLKVCVRLQRVNVPALFEKLHHTVIISAVDISKLQ